MEFHCQTSEVLILTFVPADVAVKKHINTTSKDSIDQELGFIWMNLFFLWGKTRRKESIGTNAILKGQWEL